MIRILLAFALILPLSPALAQTATCDALEPALKKKAQEILSANHAYACCDATLAECLQQAPRCRSVVRVADDVCRRVKKGEDAARIKDAIMLRAGSMIELEPPASYDLSAISPAGDADAPVVLVEYADVRCPFCAELSLWLHEEVVSGRLKGKVRHYFRLFPLRNHPGAAEGGQAFLAAAALDRFWPYMRLVYERFDRFDPANLPDWAAEAGMERDAFEKLYADPEIRRLLVESKREGLRNGVEATPTLFVNGRRYHYEMDREALVDVLLEEWERVTGRTMEGQGAAPEKGPASAKGAGPAKGAEPAKGAGPANGAGPAKGAASGKTAGAE